MQSAAVQDPAGFAELSKPEQIRYLQRLWDRISENPYDIPVPRSHLDLAEMRFANYRRDRQSAHPAIDVINRLSDKAR